jgi:ribosomal protein S6--L-glutamate ligase
MRIAILSRSNMIHSTRRLIEAADERGHTVEVIDHMKCSVLLETGKPMVSFEGRHLDNFDAVIPRIGASVTFYGSAIVRQFEMMNVFTATPSQAISRSRDKLRASQILMMSGIGMPRTAFARENVNVDEMINYVNGAPLVVKLLEGTQGLGVVLCETKKAAKSVIEAFHSLEANILVQEFIGEAKGRDVRAFVVDGQVVGAMERQGPEGGIPLQPPPWRHRPAVGIDARGSGNRLALRQSPRARRGWRGHAPKQARPLGHGGQFLPRLGRH